MLQENPPQTNKPLPQEEQTPPFSFRQRILWRIGRILGLLSCLNAPVIAEPSPTEKREKKPPHLTTDQTAEKGETPPPAKEIEILPGIQVVIPKPGTFLFTLKRHIAFPFDGEKRDPEALAHQLWVPRTGGLAFQDFQRFKRLATPLANRDKLGDRGHIEQDERKIAYLLLTMQKQGIWKPEDKEHIALQWSKGSLDATKKTGSFSVQLGKTSFENNTITIEFEGYKMVILVLQEE